MIARLNYRLNHKPIVFLNKTQKKSKKIIEFKIKCKKYLFEKVFCIICGNKDDFELLATKDRYGIYNPVSICRKCGLVQTNPRMTKESYNDFYKNEYTKLYSSTDSPAEMSFIWQRSHGKQIYDSIKRHRSNLSNLKILEIGCGVGGILSYFKDKGNIVEGFELDSKSVEYANFKGIKANVGGIFDAKEKVDLIIYSHVMEHILDPVSELKQIKKILKKDGLLYVEVPSIENVENFFESDLGRYFQNAHVYHFTKNSLNNLAKITGFNIVFSDNFIHSIWMNGKKDLLYENDYFYIKKIIKSLEKKRTRFSIKLIKAKLFRNTLYFLRTFHLDKPLKKIYFKFKKKGTYHVIP